MILESAKNDLLCVFISIYDGNEERPLRFAQVEDGYNYETIRFKCRISTESTNGADTPGSYLLEAETNKASSGIGGEAPVNYLNATFNLAGIKAIPGRYPLEVSIINRFGEETTGDIEDDTELSHITVEFADESFLIIHGEVS